MAGGQDGEDGIVVVPRAPRPIIWPGRQARDGLDDLIDELLPDTDEGPGPVDAALVAGGGVLVAWSVVGSPPVAATVAGAAVLALGCILPVRSGWRWLTGRRPRRSAGVPLRTDHPLLVRLVEAYGELDSVGSTTGAARAAAHGAVLEVATLLDGRAPASDGELRYIGARTAAVEELVAALREVDAAGEVDVAAVAPELVVEAREELDALGGVSALSRLDGVTAEIRSRGRRP